MDFQNPHKMPQVGNGSQPLIQPQKAEAGERPQSMLADKTNRTGQLWVSLRGRRTVKNDSQYQAPPHTCAHTFTHVPTFTGTHKNGNEKGEIF